MSGADNVIRDIEVSSVSLISGNFSIGWTVGADRYHFWANSPNAGASFEAGGIDVLYKNPTVPREHPDHYWTRKLDPAKPKNARVITDVLAHVRQYDMVRAAFEAQAAKEAAEEKATAEAGRRRRIAKYLEQNQDAIVELIDAATAYAEHDTGDGAQSQPSPKWRKGPTAGDDMDPEVIALAGRGHLRRIAEAGAGS